jgi:hypothetical protein
LGRRQQAVGPFFFAALIMTGIELTLLNLARCRSRTLFHSRDFPRTHFVIRATPPNILSDLRDHMESSNRSPVLFMDSFRG